MTWRANLFRSLSGFNFRLWAAGAAVSNVGTWMQRTAQDWLVLTQLTHHSATAVGVVMALQFGPQVLCLPLTGHVADHFDRRRVLLVTQTALGLLALGLGLLTVTGLVRLWQVYGFAFALGCVTAFDAPARQAFVSDLVPESHLANAVALNSTSFNGARLVGPAAAGALIAALGTGWVFLANAASFGAVLLSLALLRADELRSRDRAPRARDGLAAGFRYVWERRDLRVPLVMLSLVGTFALNYPIFISTMATTVFRRGAGEFGLLTSFMAVGSVTGALIAAAQARPSPARLLLGAFAMGVGLLLAALMPTYATFAVLLVVVGTASQTFTTTTNGTVQLATAPEMRGRVMAILMAVALGGTPIGAPVVGWVSDRFGARYGIAVGAIACFGAALLGLRQHLAKPAR